MLLKIETNLGSLRRLGVLFFADLKYRHLTTCGLGPALLVRQLPKDTFERHVESDRSSFKAISP